MSGHDGTPAQSPDAGIRQAAMLLQLAEDQLRRDPEQGGPERSRALLWSSYQALAALTAIVSHLAAAPGLEPGQRTDLTLAGVHLAAALASIRAHATPPSA